MTYLAALGACAVIALLWGGLYLRHLLVTLLRDPIEFEEEDGL